MRHRPAEAELFRRNRKRLAAELPAGAVILLGANSLVQRTGDTNYPFRQNSNFFWATGYDFPDAWFWLWPDQADTKLREILFVPRLSDNEKLWNGRELEFDEISALTGIARVEPLDHFTEVLHALDQAKHVYLADHMAPASVRLNRRLKRDFPSTTFANGRLVIEELRTVKSDLEVEQIKQAIELTALGLATAKEQLKSGIKEYELEAILTASFRRHGARLAFEAIVATGRNACTIHYQANVATVAQGDLVLLDVGAEAANYAADISRTWVAGFASARQAEVYQAVQGVQRAAIELMQADTDVREFELKVRDLVVEKLHQLGLLSDAVLKDMVSARRASLKYFPHATTHFLGLDVHDVGDITKPWEPGMVLTCEPGIYIPEEGIGVRLEDDILITAEGPLNLSAAIPQEEMK